MQRYQGFPLKEKQIDIQPVNPYEDKTLANYMCKGVHVNFINFFHLCNRAEFQGFINWQRGRVSTNLGAKTIYTSGFNASLQRNDWIELHPDIASEYERPHNWDVNEVVPQLTGAKEFIGYKEYWRRLMYEAYSYRQYYTRKKSENKIHRVHSDQMIRLDQIKKQLNYTI
ncbi:hypothetical protein ACLBWZ_16100 [Brucellaceae bacterium C25G]